MAKFLRLTARARLGHVVYSSLGVGRDRVLEHLLDSLGDDRPALVFGQSVWPPAERPSKLRADVTASVRSKAELFARLAQATSGAALIAAHDCGLSLFDLVEASLRADVQLIYLTWAPQSETMSATATSAIQRACTDPGQQAALAQAIPQALPIWTSIEHAPDGTFCVTRIAEASFNAKSTLDLRALFEFKAEEPAPADHCESDHTSIDRRWRGEFAPTGALPWCLDRLVAASGAEALVTELFASESVAGVSATDLPMAGIDSAARARRLRQSPERFDTSKRA